MQPQPPKCKPVRPYFQHTSNYRETQYLLPNAGIIPYGQDLDRYNAEVSLFWVNHRLNLRVAVGVDGKTIEESRKIGMLKTVTSSFDDQVTTVEIFMYTRMGIMAAVNLPFKIQEVIEHPDGVKTYPLSHAFDDDCNPICPACNMRMVRKADRLPFPVGILVKCPHCRASMVNRGNKLDLQKF